MELKAKQLVSLRNKTGTAMVFGKLFSDVCRDNSYRITGTGNNGGDQAYDVFCQEDWTIHPIAAMPDENFGRECMAGVDETYFIQKDENTHNHLYCRIRDGALIFRGKPTFPDDTPTHTVSFDGGEAVELSDESFKNLKKALK